MVVSYTVGNQISCWFQILENLGQICPFGPKMAQNGSNGLNSQISISHEPVAVWTWLTPHFNQKHQVSISVSYILYPSKKVPKMRFFGNNSAKNGQILLKFLPNITCIISRSLSHFDPFWANWGPWGVKKWSKMVKNEVFSYNLAKNGQIFTKYYLYYF